MDWLRQTAPHAQCSGSRSIMTRISPHSLILKWTPHWMMSCQFSYCCHHGHYGTLSKEYSLLQNWWTDEQGNLLKITFKALLHWLPTTRQWVELNDISLHYIFFFTAAEGIHLIHMSLEALVGGVAANGGQSGTLFRTTSKPFPKPSKSQLKSGPESHCFTL